MHFQKRWVSRQSEIELLQKACKGLGDWPAPPPLSPPPPLPPPPLLPPTPLPPPPPLPPPLTKLLRFVRGRGCPSVHQSLTLEVKHCEFIQIRQIHQESLLSRESASNKCRINHSLNQSVTHKHARAYRGIVSYAFKFVGYCTLTFQLGFYK